MVINVVKYLVYSICHHFCCLFLYFVQLGVVGVVGLLVIGFTFLGFALILIYILIQINMIDIGRIRDFHI